MCSSCREMMTRRTCLLIDERCQPAILGGVGTQPSNCRNGPQDVGRFGVTSEILESGCRLEAGPAELVDLTVSENDLHVVSSRFVLPQAAAAAAFLRRPFARAT